MNLKLILPTEEYREQWYDIINEIESEKEKITPLALKAEITDYDLYLKKVKNNSLGLNLDEGIVPSDIFFLVKEDDMRILGSIDIRYGLTDYLLKFGGNIGYGIRPSERMKGYATEMLRLVLNICANKGFKKVLITCYKSNIGSAKTIIKNGGILENEVIENGEIKQRYWISL